MDEKIFYYIDQVQEAMRGEYVAPVSCEIDPSNACMLNCEHCMYKGFLAQNHEFLDLKVYTRLLLELARQGTRSITFTGGGEPLMAPGFNAMLEMALLEHFEVGLVTNGVLLDRVAWLSKFKFIRISLDAPDQETYQRLKGKDYFDRVIGNIRLALEENPTVGLSYVVSDKNKDGLEKAQALADQLGVAYIQFKPAWLNGSVFSGYEVPGGEKVIQTCRFVASDTVPCAVAQLVGIVGATGDVYYCCQMRGKPEFTLGNLKEAPFAELWARRAKVVPDLASCPQCRYMNYAGAFRKLMSRGDLFFQHRNFL